MRSRRSATSIKNQSETEAMEKGANDHIGGNRFSALRGVGLWSGLRVALDEFSFEVRPDRGRREAAPAGSISSRFERKRYWSDGHGALLPVRSSPFAIETETPPFSFLCNRAKPCWNWPDDGTHHASPQNQSSFRLHRSRRVAAARGGQLSERD
jgi:hypothetical protein